MKLTDKAVDKFVESGEGFTHPSKWEFEPTDFKDCVVLTREEALGIALAMNPKPDDAHIKDWLINRIKDTGRMK